MTQPDLPFPQPAPVDIIDGPRISLRYGSAPTEIWVSGRKWRRTDRGDVFSYQGRWRAIDDYRETDNLVGKLGEANYAGRVLRGVLAEDEDGFLGFVVPEGVAGWLRPENITVIDDPQHLNKFERAIAAHLEG